MPDLTIKFDTQQQLKEFATWMCEVGEQEYWSWFEYSPNRKHLMVSFNYHGPTERGKFMKDNTILTRPMEDED
jgi:hypothetical protein